MTKLLEAIDLRPTGKRYAEKGPLSLCIERKVSEMEGPRTQMEVQAEIRLRARGVVPEDRSGQEYAHVIDTMNHMLAQEIYGEIVNELRALMVDLGSLSSDAVRERLSLTIQKMRP